MRKKHLLFPTVVLLLLLTACNGEVTESGNVIESENVTKSEVQIEDENRAYEIALKNGLEELETDNYNKAVAYFEIALEENPESERAHVLLEQAENYIEAIELFDQEVYEKARVKAEVVYSEERGSELLVARAEELLNNLDSIRDAQQATEEKRQTEKEAYEKFKGVFVEFSGKPYESSTSEVYILTDTNTLSGAKNSGYVVSEVIEKSFRENTLVLDIYTPQQAGYGEMSYQLELNVSYDENGYKYIVFDFGSESELVMYPITTDELIADGLNVTEDSQSLIDEVKTYDTHVPRTIDVLGSYSAKQIEYARVWLNVMNNHEVEQLNVYFDSAGTPINPYHDEESAVYPEDIITITGQYGYDGQVVYSGNGDGTINIYEVPTHWQARPEEFPAIYENILDTYLVYLDPMEDEQVARLIDRMTIHEE